MLDRGVLEPIPTRLFKKERDAYWLPGTEEPDGASGLGDFEGEDTDLAAGRVVGHEWRRESILLCYGIELLGAWICSRTK